MIDLADQNGTHHFVRKRGDGIEGPMFGGKTSELHRRYDLAFYARHRVVLYNYVGDNDRYKPEHSSTHTGVHRKTQRMVADAWEIYDNVHAQDQRPDHVFIDEGQFIRNIAVVVRILVQEGFHVTVAFLNTNFRGELFENSRDLLQVLNHITTMPAVCTKCGMSATMSQRLVDGKPAPYDDAELLIGVEMYEPRCLECHEVPGKPLLDVEEERRKCHVVGPS